MKHLNEELIISYIYNEISKDEFKFIKEHLKNCKECQEKINEIKETLDIIDELEEPQLLDETKENLVSKYKFNNKEILTLEELSGYLKIPVSDIYELLNEIPYLTIAGRIRFRKSSIEKWLYLSEKNSIDQLKKDKFEDFSIKLWRNVI